MRVQHGRCSFELPEGFEFLIEGSVRQTPNLASLSYEGAQASPLVITLTPPKDDHSPRVGLFDQLGELDINKFPPSIVLYTYKTWKETCPLQYSRSIAQSFREHADHLKVDFCEEDKVGKWLASRSQFSFVTNFRIYHLSYVWVTDKDLVVATMMNTEPCLEKSWKLLRRFIESVKFRSSGDS